MPEDRTKLVADLVAGEAGEVDVEDDDERARFSSDRERLVSRGCLGCCVAGILEGGNDE